MNIELEAMDENVIELEMEAEQVIGGNSHNGKSAYELAQQEGFVGTLQEWLQSLKGQDGKSAYQLWLEQGNSGTIQDFLTSLKSSKSDKSENGNQGLAQNINFTSLDTAVQNVINEQTTQVEETLKPLLSSFQRVVSKIKDVQSTIPSPKDWSSEITSLQNSLTSLQQNLQTMNRTLTSIQQSIPDTSGIATQQAVDDGNKIQNEKKSQV